MKTLIQAAVVTLFAASTAQAQQVPPAQCTGDVAVNSRVDGGDLGVLLANWGPVTSTALSRACDFDNNGQVNGADLGALLANWGACSVWYTVIEAEPNPAVVTDANLRAAIVATGLPWRVRDTATQVEMLLVPPGTFQMGCIMGSIQDGCYFEELPVHQVTLTNAFYLGRYEVTQAQWVAKMGSNPSYFVAGNGYPGSGARPVEQVSWNTIQGYLSATGFRLPTEAEWEYACRAGTQTPFYNGSQDDGTVESLAWYLENSGWQTRPVGGKLANAFGFHDMLGNVWEWVNDWYGSYSPVAQTNPTGPASASNRVLRGGSWFSYTGLLRSCYRADDSPGLAGDYIGFRVARTP